MASTTYQELKMSTLEGRIHKAKKAVRRSLLKLNNASGKCVFCFCFSLLPCLDTVQAFAARKATTLRGAFSHLKRC